ncbi:MAG: hypothetical protein JSR71_10905 [Proteobacteria bacterium]|nr:hypothetical protein [Pseudomonadota bacterium]
MQWQNYSGFAACHVIFQFKQQILKMWAILLWHPANYQQRILINRQSDGGKQHMLSQKTAHALNLTRNIAQARGKTG